MRMKQTIQITIFEHVHNPFFSLMRFTLSLLLIFAAICSTSTAQNLPPILKTVKPKRGIYATFDEFLNDAPSVQLKFVLQERSRSKQFWAGGSDFTLLIPDGMGGMKKANKYWGLCDGDSIYINVSNYQKTQGYIKLLQLGRFCYTKGATSATLEGNGAAAGVMGGDYLVLVRSMCIISRQRRKGKLLSVPVSRKRYAASRTT